MVLERAFSEQYFDALINLPQYGIYLIQNFCQYSLKRGESAPFFFLNNCFLILVILEYVVL